MMAHLLHLELRGFRAMLTEEKPLDTVKMADFFEGRSQEMPFAKECPCLQCVRPTRLSAFLRTAVQHHLDPAS